MKLLRIIQGFFRLLKEIDKEKLPSRGFFYKNDLQIFIKKADKKDISEYENEFKKDNLGIIIGKVKSVVEKNIILPNGYLFEDLKSIDIVFLFLEIVKLTKNKSINIFYIHNNKEKTIEFDSKNFNYSKIDDEIMKSYDEVGRNFKIDGYIFNLPSIGVENCLTQFLISKSNTKDVKRYANLFYDFTYFVSDKNFLTFNEIENLIEVFNTDIEEEELFKIRKILKTFTPLQKYSLIKDGIEIEINSKIDLENIWK
jgi:hypothetical protein